MINNKIELDVPKDLLDSIVYRISIHLIKKRTNKIRYDELVNIIGDCILTSSKSALQQ